MITVKNKELDISAGILWVGENFVNKNYPMAELIFINKVKNLVSNLDYELPGRKQQLITFNNSQAKLLNLTSEKALFDD